MKAVLGDVVRKGSLHTSVTTWRLCFRCYLSRPQRHDYSISVAGVLLVLLTYPVAISLGEPLPLLVGVESLFWHLSGGPPFASQKLESKLEDYLGELSGLHASLQRHMEKYSPQSITAGELEVRVRPTRVRSHTHLSSVLFVLAATESHRAAENESRSAFYSTSLLHYMRLRTSV